MVAKSPIMPAVRLHSIHSAVARSNNMRVLHIIRHAQGFHNISKDYRNPDYKDAQLTSHGINQCKQLSDRLKEEDIQIDCIICSPMRRALQTAYYSFEHHYLFKDNCNNHKNDFSFPIVACENWRETVNYICDVRLTKEELMKDFPFVDFTRIEHNHDPIWKYYEDLHGSHDIYQMGRESKDDQALQKRGREAWKTIAERPSHERSFAVVSHSAFFMHMFTRPELNIVSYGDDDVEKLMSCGFQNCEMRSVAFEIA
jgi:broad specificity phosphatase PhoE